MSEAPKASVRVARGVFYPPGSAAELAQRAQDASVSYAAVLKRAMEAQWERPGVFSWDKPCRFAQFNGAGAVERSGWLLPGSPEERLWAPPP